MDESETARLDDAVRAEVAEWGEVRPPYVAFPGFDPLDIGWRMGAGEWHLMLWAQWWDAAHPDEASRLDYFRRHQPPAAWLSWAAVAVWPELEEDVDDESDSVDEDLARRLAEHGIGAG